MPDENVLVVCGRHSNGNNRPTKWMAIREWSNRNGERTERKSTEQNSTEENIE